MKMPPYQSIFERIDRWLEQQPDRLMIAHATRREGEFESASMRELDKSARRIGAWLREDHDLEPGDRVLLAYTPSLSFARALLATLYAGLLPAPVPLPNPFDPESGIELFSSIAEDCDARAILTNTEYARARRLGAAKQIITRRRRTTWPGLTWIDTDRTPRRMRTSIERPSHAGADDVALLQYTSGSTSTPKGVMITHGNLWHQLSANAIELGVGVDTRAALWVPHYHDFGLISGLLSAIYSGSQAWFLSPLDFIRRPATWFDLITRVRATHVAAPNFAYDFSVRKTTPEERARWDLSSLQVVMSAAEPILPRTVEEFLRAFEPCGLKRDAFCPAYGLAEHTVGVSVNGQARLMAHRETLEREGALRVVAPASMTDLDEASTRELVGCGAPSVGVTLRVVDPKTRRPVAHGHTGELWVDSPSKAAGYWGRMDETREAFEATIESEPDAGSFLRTGDLGLMWEGELFVTGRIKEILILHGRNIYPQDIEETVRQCHPMIRPGGIAAFSIQPHEHEQLVVWVEVREGAPIPAIVQACREAILRAHQLIPHTLVIGTPGLVLKTTSGKIRRGACRRAHVEQAPHVYTHSIERLTQDAITDSAEITEASIVLQAESESLGEASHVARMMIATLSAPSLTEDGEDVADVDAIAEAIARVLEIEAASIDVDAPLTSLGLTSLTLIELGAVLEESGYPAPLDVIAHANSVRDLAHPDRAAAIGRAARGARARLIEPAAHLARRPDRAERAHHLVRPRDRGAHPARPHRARDRRADATPSPAPHALYAAPCARGRADRRRGPPSRPDAPRASHPEPQLEHRAGARRDAGARQTTL